jgi:hypothetical protein
VKARTGPKEMDSIKKKSVKSVYNHITRMDNGKAYKDVWKTKIHEKVRFFYVVGYAKVNPHKKIWLKETEVVIYVITSVVNLKQ